MSMNFFRAALVIAVFLTNIHPSVSQGRKTPAARSIQSEKPSPQKDLRYPHAIRTTYDADKDTSTLRVDLPYPGLVDQGHSHAIELAVLHVYQGTVLLPPESVHLILFSESSDWKLLGVKHVLITADRRRFHLRGTVERKRDASDSKYEILWVPISLPTFQGIVKAKVVEFQIGDIRFRLGAPELRELREYAKRLVQ